MAANSSTWYQGTVIYELHVRTFADGNGDGIGDFKGLIEKLGYLEKLGVGAVWLLPFYPSPLRDAGYDIADYMDVHPDCGTLADFRHFLREAHARGIKVITELVLNHTSDQHPWFRRACQAKPGSAYRDFYVWSDTTDKYRDARIIFNDFEASNWTWNETAQAYYWHRFYSHQPDLNFDSPLVRKAMFRIVDFWMGMGVDGMRLDAVPYLIEREGTSCDGLPETHAYLKELRAHIDAEFPGRMLLAEANQWPEDAVSYFGAGDECHMAFHFPLMPRIFMSLWMEDSYPIIDIINQTPDLPEGCQWGLFLRNHDELTLEMISDEERDYMFRAYARDSQARINLGIRRRLAPLMRKDRRKMELINFLLFSFRGTPIIYYGDEIGMGDNYYLGDRDGVRTPMQWTGERNAGFSSANPQALFPPLVIDPEYHYEAINVEIEERTPSSFLWWMRRLIAAYRTLPELGRGELSFVPTENPRVLAFLRTDGDAHLLVLANLSRFAQVAELDLAPFAGRVPVEALGNMRFPAVGKDPYVLPMSAHGYFWLRLEKAGVLARAQTEAPDLAYTDEAGLFGPENQLKLERIVLPALLDRYRGFAREAADAEGRLHDLAVIDTLSVRGPYLDSFLVLAEDTYESSLRNTYLFMLAAAADRRGGEAGQPQETALARIRSRDEAKVLRDGFLQPDAVRAFVTLLGSLRKRHGRSGNFRTQAYAPALLRELLVSRPGVVRPVRAASHTCTHALDKAVYIKFYRRPTEGINPEVEILNILAAVRFPGVPRLLASLSFQAPRGNSMTLAVAMEYVQGAKDGDAFIREALGRFFERVLAANLAGPLPVVPNPLGGAYNLTDAQSVMMDAYVDDFFRRLGNRLMQLHKVFAGMSTPSMAPERFSKVYLRSIYQTMRSQIHRVSQGVEILRRAAEERGDPPLRLFPAQGILNRFTALLRMEPTGLRIRVHGDFRLGSVLHLGKDFMLVNFDGNARLPVSERVLKHSPLRDVAGMLFSVGMAADAALRAHLEHRPTDKALLLPWLALWRHNACNAFLEGYYENTEDCAFLPRAEADRRQFLELSVLKQILNRLEYSLEENPEDTPVLLEIAEALLRILP